MRRSDAARLFVAMRAHFVAAGYDVSRATLYLDSRRYGPGSPRRFRDLAWCETPSQRVVIVARALRLEPARIAGLLAHELGHLADGRVHRKGRERRADRLARQALGQPILYDERDVQNLARGRTRRPSYLHQ